VKDQCGYGNCKSTIALLNSYDSSQCVNDPNARAGNTGKMLSPQRLAGSIDSGGRFTECGGEAS
jgi:hypothetical protein